jgi:drug/metabolite transporter (DMT)-like permease
MNTKTMLGVAIALGGVLLLALGYRASGSPVDQISNAFTGQYTDRTMWYIGAGIVAVIGGSVLAVCSSRGR